MFPTFFITQFMIIAGFSSIFSAVLQNPEANNIKTLFAYNFDVQTADNNQFGKFVIYRFTQYVTTNIEDYSLWDFVQGDFAKYKIKQFDKLDTNTEKVVKNHCYLRGFWINHNFGPGRTLTTVMLKTVDSKQNNKWTLEQISWVKDRYSILLIITCKYKQQYTGIPNLNFLATLNWTQQICADYQLNHIFISFKARDFKPNYNKYHKIKANHYLNNNFLYHKMYIIILTIIIN